MYLLFSELNNTNFKDSATVCKWYLCTEKIETGIYIYIYINVWKSSQRMNLRDVGSETSVNDTVQTNKNDKYTSKMLAQRYKKKDVKM